MAEMTKPAQEAVATEVKKVVRRGVGSARGTTRLKFTHTNAKSNGLFVAHLDDVTVKSITIGEDTTGMPSFNGLEIPKLILTFASNEEDVNKRQYVTLQFTAVESNANTIPGGKEEWKVNSIFDWFKHLLNVYVLKGREMTAEEEAALSLSFEDFNEEGEYVPVDVEDVIAGWKTLFENFENLMNRGREGQPYFKSKDGKFISVWIKLLRYVKSKKGWSAVNNGDLAFPAFVGEGCVEILKQNSVPALRVDSIREDIKPRDIQTAKKPNMPSANMMGGMGNMMGGVPVNDLPGDPFDGIGAAAGEDMPFGEGGF